MRQAGLWTRGDGTEEIACAGAGMWDTCSHQTRHALPRGTTPAQPRDGPAHGCRHATVAVTMVTSPDAVGVIQRQQDGRRGPSGGAAFTENAQLSFHDGDQAASRTAVPLQQAALASVRPPKEIELARGVQSEDPATCRCLGLEAPAGPIPRAATEAKCSTYGTRTPARRARAEAAGHGIARRWCVPGRTMVSALSEAEGRAADTFRLIRVSTAMPMTARGRFVTQSSGIDSDGVMSWGSAASRSSRRKPTARARSTRPLTAAGVVAALRARRGDLASERRRVAVVPRRNHEASTPGRGSAVAEVSAMEGTHRAPLKRSSRSNRSVEWRGRKSRGTDGVWFVGSSADKAVFALLAPPRTPLR